MDGIQSLTPKQVAQALNKSTSWVYEHADQLGAIRIGGSIIFTEQRLKGIFDADQGEKWEIPSSYQNRRQAVSKNLRNQGRRKKNGKSRKKPG